MAMRRSDHEAGQRRRPDPHPLLLQNPFMRRVFPTLRAYQGSGESFEHLTEWVQEPGYWRRITDVMDDMHVVSRDQDAVTGFYAAAFLRYWATLTPAEVMEQMFGDWHNSDQSTRHRRDRDREAARRRADDALVAAVVTAARRATAAWRPARERTEAAQEVERVLRPATPRQRACLLLTCATRQGERPYDAIIAMMEAATQKGFWPRPAHDGGWRPRSRRRRLCHAGRTVNAGEHVRDGAPSSL